MDTILELDVRSLAYGGDAVARAEDGRTVFVTGACPGDRVAARVTADHGRFLNTELVEVLDPSPERREPPCPYFGECGGCQWQHVSHAAQVTAKRTAVSDALTRIGGVEEAAVAEVVVGGRAYGYRNKMELRHGTDAAGRLVLGLTARGTDRVVPIESCLLMPERCRAVPKALMGALRYLSSGGDLGIERVAVRAATHTRDLEVALWGEPGPFPRAMAATTLARAVKTTSLVRVLMPVAGKSRSSAKIEILGGTGSWKERLGGRTMRVSAPSFFQVNTPVAELLVAEVMRAVEPDGSDRVLDAYAGAGTFTLPLAESAGEVVAAEMTGAALRDLERNLETAGLDADVVGGDVVRELPSLGRFDVIVADPPRAGMDAAALRAMAAAGPRRIVYVSCDPSTLARDSKRLAEQGYSLTAAVPVDLFPQTYHIETVASFDRTGR
ncbi:MAG TPA: 23S rRNA (uracil(1939)-C(5))-methyltransferase RlmD [Coriobacteriia bacterium]